MSNTIVTKYDGKCADCGAVVPAGATARYYGRNRLYGTTCHPQKGETPATTPAPAVVAVSAPAKVTPIRKARTTTAVATNGARQHVWKWYTKTGKGRSARLFPHYSPDKPSGVRNAKLVPMPLTHEEHQALSAFQRFAHRIGYVTGQWDANDHSNLFRHAVYQPDYPEIWPVIEIDVEDEAIAA